MSQQISRQKNYVLYHDNCADGFAAAWMLSHHLYPLPTGRTAEFIPVQYNRPMPPIDDGSVVYIVDFSYPRQVLIDLAKRSHRLVVLDHHKTAAKDLDGLNEELNRTLDLRSHLAVIGFDMDQSGAMMVWDYFHADEYNNMPPIIIQYVQDRDLWKWELPYSREFSAALAVVPKDFETWNELSNQIDFIEDIKRLPAFMDFIQDGRERLHTTQLKVQAIADRAVMGQVGGHYPIPIVETANHQSEVGERLCQMYPESKFAATHFALNSGDQAGDQVWSLRSREGDGRWGEGGFDVSEVAKGFGGGGHRNAAGFHITKEKMEREEKIMEGFCGVN